jgi:3-oxoacyl-[acyl-carrier protein] reductase
VTQLRARRFDAAPMRSVRCTDEAGRWAAILGFTKSWAKELAPHRITVNAIAPGGVTSPMAIEKDGIEAVRERMAKVPLGRWAEPDEIAQGMLYLVTAGFVTGQMLNLNGGDTIVGI